MERLGRGISMVVGIVASRPPTFCPPRTHRRLFFDAVVPPTACFVVHRRRRETTSHPPPHLSRFPTSPIGWSVVATTSPRDLRVRGIPLPLGSSSNPPLPPAAAEGMRTPAPPEIPQSPTRGKQVAGGGGGGNHGLPAGGRDSAAAAAAAAAGNSTWGCVAIPRSRIEAATSRRSAESACHRCDRNRDARGRLVPRNLGGRCSPFRGIVCTGFDPIRLDVMERMGSLSLSLSSSVRFHQKAVRGDGDPRELQA